MTNKTIHIIGGGTISHVRTHLALCAPAYGSTARKLVELCRDRFGETMDIKLHLTKMANPKSNLETWEDLKNLTSEIMADSRSKMVFYNPAVVDFFGVIDDVNSGKHAKRLNSKENHTMTLGALPKLISKIRNDKINGIVRKDILLIGFKATCGALPQEQYLAGLNMLKATGCNLVLANDVESHVNMIIVPEEARYHETTNREEALKNLVDMAYYRSHLTFTRSTVVDGQPVPWDSELVPTSLRKIVDYCIFRGAYKRVRGVTAGHFAVRVNDQTFLSSVRKTDFNDMKNTGLVMVKTDGPDSMIAYGRKPSVGGQSQRIIFSEHAGYDCIVHFHCPKKELSLVPTVSQREFECGSHECGKNTSNGLKRFGSLSAVYLDSHGPNIVFNRSINPQEVIDFIDANFDLSEKTGGYKIE
ncbi:MAG: phosphopantothenoylcysteine decarboxylase [bacterium]|nr:phosphopantothenoylcysteine decarboxylase [bacterium]